MHHSQVGGMQLATVGSLPFLIALIIYGVFYIIVGLVTLVDKISDFRLLIYSLIVFCIMVFEAYTLFALETVPQASKTVRKNIALL